MHAVSAVTRHSCLLVESATHSFLCGLQPHRSTCGLPDGLGPRACSGMVPFRSPHARHLAWAFSHIAFQGRIVVIGMQLNLTWIQIELTKKWSDYLWAILLEEVVLTMHSGIAVSHAILFLVCKSNHFQLTHRHSKHSVFFQCFASCGVSLPLCVNSVQS